MLQWSVRLLAKFLWITFKLSIKKCAVFKNYVNAYTIACKCLRILRQIKVSIFDFPKFTTRNFSGESMPIYVN